MQRNLLLAAMCCLLSLVAAAQPRNNAYYQLYGFVPGHWTDSLNWHKVFNIADYSGATMVDRLNAAQDDAVAAGGGVIYFPAGTYNFEDNVRLRSGVILRGDDPAVNNAKDAAFAPPSRLVFPEYVPTFTGNGTPNSTAFKTITGVQGCSNAGLVNLDINRAGISFRSCCFVPVQTPKGSTNRSLDTNRNIIVLGVRSNNVAVPDAGVPATGQLGWQRFSSRFAANISILVKRNSVVANCRVNDFMNNTTHPISDDSYFQPGYLWERTVSGVTSFIPVDSAVQAPFRYTDHHGISVGRKSAVTFAEPEDEPDLFSPGNEILDNWIYKTMRVGIYAGGMGLVIKGNIIRDSNAKRVWIHPAGIRFQTNNSATYENRGIDWSGWHVRVEENDVQVTRHRIGNSPYPSVDGEGILIQECCGGTSVNGIAIRKNNLTGGGYIGIYKTRDVHNCLIDSNNLGNQPIWVWANTNGQTYALNSTVIDANYNTGNIICDGSRGGSPSYVTNNQGTGTITAPCHVIVQNNNTYNVTTCTPVPTAPYPVVAINSPLADTAIDVVTQTVNLDAQLTAGTADSLWYYWGTQLIYAGTPATSAFQWNLPQQNGRYAVAALVRDASGRTAWSPYRVINYCVGCTTANKPLAAMANLRVYPNPATGLVRVVLPLPQTQLIDLQLLDLSGRLQHRQLVTPGADVQIDMAGVPAGTYLLQANHGDARYVARVVKE